MKKRYPILLMVWLLAAFLVSCSGQADPSLTQAAISTSAEITPVQAVKTFQTATPTRMPIATPGCDQGFSNLAVGQYAVVAQGGHPNRVRSTPHVLPNNVIGSIDSGAFGKIVDGPVCTDGLVFWRLESDYIPSGSGWTAEGDLKTHWLLPYTH